MTATTTTTRPMLAALLALLNCFFSGSGCSEPCRPRIAQVLPGLGLVRVVNDCEGPVDWQPLQLCAGLDTYAKACASLDPGKAIDAGACIDVAVKMPDAPEGAFGVGIFTVGKNVATAPPVDSAIWGGANASMLDETGHVGAPLVPAIEQGKALTRGANGWYMIDKRGDPTACEVFGHVITVQQKSCAPQLVEVHPGPGAFFKVALPPECPAVDLGEHGLMWGGADLQHGMPLPERLLFSGDCAVFGDPPSTAANGWPQWQWPGLDPLAPSTIAPVPTGTYGVGVAAVTTGGKTSSGVVYSGEIGNLPDWPNLDPHVGAVPPGKSLRWTGATWIAAPASPNNCPRWDVQAAI